MKKQDKSKKRLLELLAKYKFNSKVSAPASYLPMLEREFHALYDIPLSTGEISSVLKFGEVVLGFAMNNKFYFMPDENIDQIIFKV